ncbi:MAG: inorganic phosphate transporter [Betaproteobacteria bacterium]|nr:inorganic phosphate transporter [Betaproteobacteria bacterium]
MSTPESSLVMVALAFAWRLGTHYTGACMGMPQATGRIGLRPVLWTMAFLAWVGATFFSHKVRENVGHHILVADRLGTVPAIAVIAAAFVLTTVFTQRRIPTSTIQILVFCIIGAGAALGLGVRWGMIIHLAALWILAPLVACGLGVLFTKLFDRIPDFVRSGAAGAILGFAFAWIAKPH